MIELVQADITRQEVDAIVNAANSDLAHGGGVARAIADAAGDELAVDSVAHPWVPTGGVGVTRPGRLHCRYVIHAVGPIWHGGSQDEPRLLARAYRQIVVKAAELGCRTVACPSISTGVYRFPLDRAALIAIGSTVQALAEHPDVQLVRFCLFSDQDLTVYRRALEETV